MAYWIPPEQRGPEYGIFNGVYHVRCNAQAIRSIEHIRQYGTYSSGDAEIDRAIKSVATDYYMTIAEIATHFGNGIDIAIAKHEDTKKIFEIIEEYLSYRKHQFANRARVNNQNLINDLILLDRLRMTLYPFAKPFFPVEATGSDLLDSASKQTTFNPLDLFKPTVDTNTGETLPEEGPTPMAEEFASYRPNRPKAGMKPKIWK